MKARSALRMDDWNGASAIEMRWNGRPAVEAGAPFENAPVTAAERTLLFEAFCQSALWVRPYFLWRANLPDEADNHVLELALNGHAQALVSWNVRDLARGELRFPHLRIADPVAYLAHLDSPGD